MVIWVKSRGKGNKYFWLKLQRGFFKRHDILAIERYGGYPDGPLMAYFYTKMLVESIDHNGYLRFSVEKPYTNVMLAAIMGVDIKVVDKAMTFFEELGLIKKLEDKTIYMVNIDKMLGVGSSTNRVRAFRERRVDDTYDEDDDNIIEDNNDSNDDEQEEVKEKKSSKRKVNTTYDNEFFTQFWAVYPRKVGKDKCYNWFKTRNITQEFVDDLVIAIKQQKKSEQWNKVSKDGVKGAFIPHPYTWLNRGGWNDELTYKQSQEQKIINRWEAFIGE